MIKQDDQKSSNSSMINTRIEIKNISNPVIYKEISVTKTV